MKRHQSKVHEERKCNPQILKAFPVHIDNIKNMSKNYQEFNFDDYEFYELFEALDGSLETNVFISKSMKRFQTGSILLAIFLKL